MAMGVPLPPLHVAQHLGRAYSPDNKIIKVKYRQHLLHRLNYTCYLTILTIAQVIPHRRSLEWTSCPRVPSPKICDDHVPHPKPKRNTSKTYRKNIAQIIEIWRTERGTRIINKTSGCLAGTKPVIFFSFLCFLSSNFPSCRKMRSSSTSIRTAARRLHSLAPTLTGGRPAVPLPLRGIRVKCDLQKHKISFLPATFYFTSVSLRKIIFSYTVISVAKTFVYNIYIFFFPSVAATGNNIVGPGEAARPEQASMAQG